MNDLVREFRHLNDHGGSRTCSPLRADQSGTADSGEQRPVVAAAPGSVLTDRARASRGVAIQRAGWQNVETRTAVRDIKQQYPEDPTVHTLHHIIPRNTIERFVQCLSPEQLAEVVNQLERHAPTAFVGVTSALTAREVSKALKNLPVNFVLGPRGNYRDDEPGDQPDYNYTRSGRMTPRSQVLEDVYESMLEVVSAGSVSDRRLQADVLNPLVRACAMHNRTANYGVGLDPGRAHWTQDPDSGRWSRA